MLISILSMIGSLAMFMYGMKTMSEGLEKVAGERMRSILAAMTKNRVMGVLSGILITALIQSSSATTVMVVSFVNTGLMTLTQSIGVIMGANIGTTITSWIVSLVGFKMNLANLALPLLAIALPMYMSSKSKWKNISQFIFGFAILFLSLKFLNESAEDMKLNELVANMLSGISCDSFWVILLFVVVGAIVTMIVQASAATMTITLMLFNMNIPGFGFEQAVALTMGQNIGTTITAFLASLSTNTQAKRTALAHMFFNVFGVVVFLLIFYPSCNAVNWFMTDVLHNTNEMNKLSAFHTAFNIVNTLLLIWFVPQIEKFVCWVLPQKKDDEESDFRLKHISKGLVATPELSLLEAKKEIANFGQRCYKMFGMVKNLLTTTDKDQFEKEFNRITKYEKITDNMEVEIANYLDDVDDDGLSREAKIQSQKMMKTIGELESIGDSCYNLGRTLNHKREQKMDYTPEQMGHINAMMEIVDKSLQKMNADLERAEGTPVDFDKTMQIEKDINDFRKLLKETNIKDISADKYDYSLGVLYMDFINECEHLGDYVVNVVQSSK
ncbi:MAG: Na/Pi cotransporter family protein [Bacteroidales bacterium]|nr:Na/Pi cotransporter family protein [Bacteroidales bacterium]